MKIDKKAVLKTCSGLEEKWKSESGGLEEKNFCPFRSEDLLEYIQLVREYITDSTYRSYEALINDIGEEDFDAVYGVARILRHLKTMSPDAERFKNKNISLNAVQIVAGDMEVENDLSNGGILVVLGNLQIGGIYWDRDVGCQLVVLGSARIGRANILGGARIGGDMTIEQALWGIDHSDGLFIGGTLRTKLAMIDDKIIRANNAEIDFLVADDDSIQLMEKGRQIAHLTRDSDELRQYVLPELVFDPDQDSDGYDSPLNVDLIFDYLKAGKSIWKNG